MKLLIDETKREQFIRMLDNAIVAGGSNAQIARQLGIGEVTVRRRKAALGKAGLLPVSRRIVREACHAINNL